MEARAIQRTVRQSARKMRLVIDQIRGRALRENQALDVDQLRIRYAVVNEGPTLKRFTPAAMGRATPIKKRTSHVEIHVVATAETRGPKAAPATGAAPTKRQRGGKGKATAKRTPTKAKAAAAGATSRKKEGK